MRACKEHPQERNRQCWFSVHQLLPDIEIQHTVSAKVHSVDDAGTSQGAMIALILGPSWFSGSRGPVTGTEPPAAASFLLLMSQTL